MGTQPFNVSAGAGQPIALSVQYHYDANGNLAQATNAGAGAVYWQADPGASIPAVNAWDEAEA